MGMFSSLSSEQKEATGILQIGTFLEYFDLMLYVHMSVILNELFFPKTAPHTASLIAAGGFCATFVFRPFGALIFGYIGDVIGRKPTVVITTMMMALSCVVMATLPSYAQIGIMASWAVTICRIIQGMSSMGEIIGAEIYLTELVDVPLRYPIVALMDCASGFGTLVALAVAAMVFAVGLDWRVAFWIGALVALIGTIARTTLRETPDFLNAKHLSTSTQKKQKVINLNSKIDIKTLIAYFILQCGGPLCFYFTYMYCGGILKNLFNYNSQQIIYHNLIVASLGFLWTVVITFLSYKIYPLKIIKVISCISSAVVLLIPYLLSKISLPWHLILIQIFTGALGFYVCPAKPIFFTYFPVLKRFTCVGFIYALSRAFIYVITSFGLVYLTEKYGAFGLLGVFIPVMIGFGWGLLHFENIEKIKGNYPVKDKGKDKNRGLYVENFN